MKIGNVEIENNIFLGPMAGVTDLSFRRLCREYGCGVTCSEMVSAKGLHYNDKKTASLMALDSESEPCAIQIFGSEPEIMAEAAKKAEAAGAAFVDINMGCPMPKIVNNGDGSALMKNPAAAADTVYAAARAVAVPVTVKIRKGWETETAPEFAKMLEESGAAAITVHGRTREQFYSGEADWQTIKRVKESVGIPVIGNGDIFAPEDALKMMEQTGCDGVMIARGARGNPFIFREVREFLENRTKILPPTATERLETARRHAHMLAMDKGESRGIKEARKHIAWYIKGMRDSAAAKNRIFKAVSLEEIDEVFEYMMSNLK